MKGKVQISKFLQLCLSFNRHVAFTVFTRQTTASL